MPYSIVVSETVGERGRSVVRAEIAEGDLVVRGEDTGAQVESWFGSSAYEYGLVVKSEDISKLLSVLEVSSSQLPDLPHILKRRFDDGLHGSFDDLRRWLKSKRIPSEFWSHIED